jgi:hypothetical protein
MHNPRTFATIKITDLEFIDFEQIEEDSKETIRKSLDDTQFVIKWLEGYTPTFITDASVIPIGTYDHHAILELMQTPFWTEPIPITE